MRDRRGARRQLDEPDERHHEADADRGDADAIAIARTERDKCGRCWRYLPEVEEDGALCARCNGVVNGR
ncbi:MAG: hypothetical protein KY433_12900 [Actinobacteria bacterium]|nr:hypothetical protein [Actinomycetota bacterium]